MLAEDAKEFENLQEKFGHFSILIVGRANAGKTTILRGTCNSTENPEVHDGDGNKVWIQVDVRRSVVCLSMRSDRSVASPGIYGGGHCQDIHGTAADGC